jgi:hypothetical protein
VALADDGHKSPFGSAPALKEPVGIVAALAELGNPQLDGAGPGVEVALPVSVAPAHSIVAPLAVASTAHGVGFGGHERLREGSHHFTQEINVGPLQLPAQPTHRVHPQFGHCLLLDYGI